MPQQVALTFETGGDPVPAQAILETLASAGATATFFVDGTWAEANPTLLERIAREGHELGTHGFAHPDWTALGDEAVIADLHATEEVVDRITGGSVKPWARPPYGALDERVAGILERCGYTPIYRDAVDGAHWPGQTSPASVEERALSAARGDGVVTFHTNSPFTAEALPRVLGRLDGAALVRLQELGEPPSPRVARHADFAAVAIRPGYVRPNRPGGRWHSLNLLELGAAATAEPGAARVVETAGLACDLVTGSGDAPLAPTVSQDDRYTLVLAGELRCELGESGEVGALLARTGDLFLCPAGVPVRLGPTAGGRRFVAAVWQAS